MNASPKSLALVVLQLGLLLAIAVTGPVVPSRPIPLALIGAGGALGLWALFVVRIRNLRIVPEPVANARLVVSGPYRVIRHPMYAAVLLVASGWLVGSVTVFRSTLLLALAIILLLKLRHEESILAKELPGYADYMRRTRRLVPWVY